MKRTSLKRTPMKRKTSTLRRKPAQKTSGAKKTVKRKKDTFADIRRSYGLPDVFKGKGNLRYKQPIERGILWYWFSRFIRQVRDKEAPCINCGKHKDDYHGGHFIAAGSCSVDDMVFSEDNVHKECSACNKRDKAKLKYAYNLDKRYGPGSAQALRDYFNEYKFGGGTYKNWPKSEYIAKINHYRSIVERLDHQESLGQAG